VTLAECLQSLNLTDADKAAVQTLIDSGVSDEEAVLQQISAVDSETSELAGQIGEAGGQVEKAEAPLKQSVPFRRGTRTLRKYGLDPKKTHKTRDIAAALETWAREKFGKIEKGDHSPEAMRKIAKWMTEEVMYEMEHPEKSGVGWYSEKFQEALDVFGSVFPELNTDQDKRDLVTSLIAITSDGQKVVPNFRMAMDLYSSFRETGIFSTERGHQRGESINLNVENIQTLYDKLGGKGMRNYLMQERTISNLKKLAKAEGIEFTTAYQAKIKMPMAAIIFGPKLGAFYANLMGAHGYLTMDRWWSRTFNRYRGTLLQAPTRQGLNRFKQLLGQPDMSDDEVLSAVIAPRDAYAAKNFKNGTEIERAANTIHKAAFENLQDAPFNATDRTFMLQAVDQAQKNLKRRGHDITVADIQAILWYYEKRLYGDLGARQTADISYQEAAAIVANDFSDAGGRLAQRPVETADRDGPAGIPPGEEVVQGINLEFAPDPANVTLTDAFNALSLQGKREATYDAAQTILPKILTELGVTNYSIEYTQGGFQEESNPSVILYTPGLAAEKRAELAKVIGYVGAQQATISYDESVTTGEGLMNHVRVVPPADLSSEEQHELYTYLQSKVDGVGGYTWQRGGMTIGDFGEVGETFISQIETAMKSYSKLKDAGVEQKAFQSDYLETTLEGTRYGKGKKAGRKGDLPGEGGRGDVERLNALQQETADILQRHTGGVLKQGAVRAGSRLADGVQRDEATGIPVDDQGNVPLTHWSGVQGLDSLDPAYWGTAAAGQEKTLAGSPNFEPRTYFGLPGYIVEVPVASTARHRYFSTVTPAIPSTSANRLRGKTLSCPPVNRPC